MSESPVQTLGDERDHYWLAVSMAQAAGVDLVTAMEEERLTQQDWSDLVQNCRSCRWEREGGGCSRWLDLQVPGAADVPRACVNHDVFDRLGDGASS